MGRALAMVRNHLGLEAFNEMEIAATNEAIALAELMLQERHHRVQGFAENLGALLGMNLVLDSWEEITASDPTVVLN